MDDVSSLLSESGLAVLANRDVYVADDELETMRQEQERKRRAMAEAQTRRVDRAQRQTVHSQKVQSVVSDAPAASSLNWRDRVRAMGAHLPSAAPVASVATPPPPPSTRPPQSPPPQAQVDQRAIDEAVRRAVERMGKPQHQERLKRYVAEELKHRMDGIRSEVGGGGGEEDPETDEKDEDLLGKEQRYWRQYLSLEDQEVANGFTTVVLLIADVVETMLSDVMDFHVFETKGLSDQMKEAVDGGRFRSAIRRFRDSGGASFMKDPYKNALTTFAGIALKNHMDAQKGVVTKVVKKPDEGLKKKREKNKAKLKERQRKRKQAAESKKAAKTKAKSKAAKEEVASSSEEEEDEEEEEEEPVPVPIKQSKKPPRTRTPPPPAEEEEELPVEPKIRTPPPKVKTPPAKVATKRRTPLTPPKQPAADLDTSFNQLLGGSDAVESVVDDETGESRPSLVGTGPADMMHGALSHMQKLAPAVGHISQGLKKTAALQEQRDALGKPPGAPE